MDSSYQKVVREIEILMCNHHIDESLVRNVWDRYCNNQAFKAEIDSRRSINVYFNYCFKKYVGEYVHSSFYQR